MSTAPSMHERFHALDRFLTEHQSLWRPRPFVCRTLPWEADYPELAAWLRARSLADAETAHNQPGELAAPEPFPHLAAFACELGQIDELPASELPAVEHRQNLDIPGRKSLQIQAFGARLRFREKPLHWLDWCAGKGHLGRHLARDGAALTCLEWDEALVEAGAQLSQRLGIAASHRCQDVLAASAAEQLHAFHTPVALHACGDLHVRLLQLAIAKQCRQLAVAPCCYNRTSNERYTPLSQAARASSLQLSRDDLGLPLSETVTAGARERRNRDQSMAWRLGFDTLQRRLRQQDDYLPTPSLPSAWLKKDFADYCRDLAMLKQLPAPGEENWEALERAGWQRLAEVRNLELVRGLFRRPLELWLLLDRALLLEEQGYRVRLGTFCPSQLTPRNLLLLAELDAPAQNVKRPE
ncbi:methyltransferase [Stutzerimonas decontaminans]|uniref:Methyltransferase n=2 Tax=Stutzerimonas TaxID=2901164 RepID=A0ABX4VW28_9GAMM|nr:methyltransferase [Stutzerimonas decontaminans]AHY44717.1 SAM-dependent methyltransferase [Stutzerimonas decontaminans]MCQ4244741.1 SAM-dependent methyltransferase [Stutzerimonas decontaminans]PNF84158.1 methyltransferase [Stutzerimonas decontaminans]